jgi:hypothetical protein
MSRPKELRRHLNYANVMSTIAVVIAVAGIPTAIAVTNKPGKNTVTTKSIKNGSVTAKDLAPTQVVSTTGPADGLRTVTCGSGERLIGGGASADPATAGDPRLPAIQNTRPNGDLSGWVASASTGAVPYALCLDNTPRK